MKEKKFYQPSFYSTEKEGGFFFSPSAHPLDNPAAELTDLVTRHYFITKRIIII